MRTSFFVLVMLAGCTNPDEILPLHGALHSSEPVEGQVVSLLRKRQPRDPTTPYLECDSSEATSFKETTADAQGDYGFDVFRVEVQPLVGFDAFCFRVDTTFSSGARAWSDFNGIYTESRIGTFRDWRAQPSLERDGVLRFEPPRPLPVDVPPMVDDAGRWHVGAELAHRVTFVTSDGGLAWDAIDRIIGEDGGLTRVPLVLDDLRTEDFEGAVTLLAALDEREFETAYGVSSTITPPPVRLQADQQLTVRGPRPAFSRGLPCPEWGTPCPLTDGELSVVDGGMRESLSFDLEPPRIVSQVVLRGAELSGKSVSVSLTEVDGGIFRVESLLAQGSYVFEPTSRDFVVLADGNYRWFRPYFVSIALDAGTPVKRVTVRFPDGLKAMREASLFGPSP